jgi:hypothetical protein
MAENSGKTFVFVSHSDLANRYTKDVPEIIPDSAGKSKPRRQECSKKLLRL